MSLSLQMKGFLIWDMKCGVCDGKASGFHYGVEVCLACKVRFAKIDLLPNRQFHFGNEYKVDIIKFQELMNDKILNKKQGYRFQIEMREKISICLSLIFVDLLL